MKKISLILIITLALLITGCGKKRVYSSPSSIKSTDDLTKSEGSISCTRDATIQGNGEPSFNYYISYKDDNILVLHSIEKITSDDQQVLDQYDEAYQKINKSYKNLKYYDTKVYRTDNSVARDTTINYEKIDTDKLLKIENTDDNVIVNGKAKLNKWLDLALKLGVVCDED